MAEPEYLDARIVRALSHPLRPQILEVLTNRGEASPKEIAKELGEPLDSVSYHMRFLRDAGYIELVRTEPRRGAVEHYYRAVLRPFLDDAQWERMPLAVRRQLAGQTIGRILKAVAAAAEAGGFDRPGAHVDRVALALDEEGWRKLSALLLQVLDQVAAIQAESDERRGETEAIAPSELSILHYAVEESRRGRAVKPGGSAQGGRTSRGRRRSPRA
jgi:DNA-binding transcriptional ArsR family regulator